MNILSSIIPGFRELRSPVAAGLLWLAVIVTLLVTHHVVLIPHSTATASLRHISSTFAAAFFTSVILASAYLIGSVMMSVTKPIINVAGGMLRRGLLGIFRLANANLFDKRSSRRMIVNLEARTRRISVSARGLVIDSVTKSLGDIGVPGPAALIFPATQVLDTLSFSAPQLSQTAPTQYQEYDRTRSEVEFRLAIVPPMVLLAAIAPINGRAWIATGTILAGLILLFQALYQERRANDILANAAYLGYVVLPMVQTVAAYLSRIKHPQNDGEWMGAIIAGLANGAYFEASEAVLHELAEFNIEDLSDAQAYLQANAPGEANTLDRIIEIKNSLDLAYPPTPLPPDPQTNPSA
jgi:hypothetical protein